MLSPTSSPFEIVVTLGPASLSLARALRDAGATAFRLNASHLDGDELAAALAAIRQDAPGTPVVVDLQGAKMRLGQLRPRSVAAGEAVVFSLDAGSEVPLPHPEFFAQAGPGDTLSVDDGRFKLRVLTRRPARLEAVALGPGRLLPRKGVNLVEHPVALERLADADRAAIAIARRFAVSSFAFSFMRDGRESEWVKALDPGCTVAGKIERREAAEGIEAIARRVDAAWICRGDLGVQLGEVKLARLVADLAPRALPVPVLMAGQVLEHLTAHSEPTRSEVCHLFDLAARGYAGIVLSDETAVGHDPVNAARTAARLLAEFATSLPSRS